jgi:hypothetical protein
MTVKERIEKLTKLGRLDMEVTTEYHMHDYIRTVLACPVKGVHTEVVRLDDKQMVIPRDDQERLDENCCEVVVIA